MDSSESSSRRAWPTTWSRRAIGTLGHVDILVNNAGGGVIRPTLEHTEESLRATIDNNLWTTIHCVRAVLPHMVSRGHGRIINIGADSVRTGLMDHAMYNAAKGGVHAMVSGLAREFATDGVTANTVAPCYMPNPRTGRSCSKPAKRHRVSSKSSSGARPSCRSGGPDDRRSRRGRRLPGRRGQPIHHRPNDLRQRRQQHGLMPLRHNPKESMTLTTTPLREAADRLIAAAAEPLQCDPVRDILGDKDIASTYEVQRLLTEPSLAQGRQIICPPTPGTSTS